MICLLPGLTEKGDATLFVLNRLASSGATTYSHDMVGNRLTRGTLGSGLEC